MKLAALFETSSLLEKSIKLSYKGYTISKTPDGQYHVTKGGRFIGHGRDHQEAMRAADKDMMNSREF